MEKDYAEHVGNYRYYYKVCAGPAPGGNPCVYFSKGFTFDSYMRWKWYLDYRAALIKVQHPRWWVDVITGKTPYIPTDVEQLKRLNDKITGKRRTISMYRNRINEAREKWTELFPLEDRADYKRAMIKIETLEHDLVDLLQQLSQIQNTKS